MSLEIGKPADKKQKESKFDILGQRYKEKKNCS